MPFCHMCGSELPQGSAFCGSCGARQETSAPVSNHQPAAPAYNRTYAPAPAPKKRRPFLKFLLILLIIVIVAAAGLIVIKYTGIQIPGVGTYGIDIPVIGNVGGKPKAEMTDEEMITDLIQRFEKAFTSGKQEKMLDCMDPAMRAATEASIEEMNAELAESINLPIKVDNVFGLAKLLGDFCDIIINDIQITGDRAVVYATMNMNFMGDTSTEETEMSLIKIDGEWYLGGSDDPEGFDFFGMF